MVSWELVFEISEWTGIGLIANMISSGSAVGQFYEEAASKAKKTVRRKRRINYMYVWWSCNELISICNCLFWFFSVAGVISVHVNGLWATPRGSPKADVNHNSNWKIELASSLANLNREQSEESDADGGDVCPRFKNPNAQNWQTNTLSLRRNNTHYLLVLALMMASRSDTGNDDDTKNESQNLLAASAWGNDVYNHEKRSTSMHSSQTENGTSATQTCSDTKCLAPREKEH
jgi:hypothetical protein